MQPGAEPAGRRARAPPRRGRRPRAAAAEAGAREARPCSAARSRRRRWLCVLSHPAPSAALGNAIVHSPPPQGGAAGLPATPASHSSWRGRAGGPSVAVSWQAVCGRAGPALSRRRPFRTPIPRDRTARAPAHPPPSHARRMCPLRACAHSRRSRRSRRLGHRNAGAAAVFGDPCT